MNVYVPGRPDVYLDRVDIVWSEAEGPGEFDMPAHYTVWPYWAGVDRPQGYGMSTGKNKRLAERYKAAYEAGAVLGTPEVRTDGDGKTYVSVSSKCLGRMLNADLKRLGF